MVSHLFVSGSGWGKTSAILYWLLPILLQKPKNAHPLNPERFEHIFVTDKPTLEHPKGQFLGARRYDDLSAWLRASDKARYCSLAHYDKATVAESLAQLALREVGRDKVQLPRTLLVFDELDEAIPESRPLTQATRPYTFQLVEAGRHQGVVAIGGARRLHSVNVRVRANLQTVWFGKLVEKSDKDDAADMMEISRRQLDRIEIKQYQFLEYSRSDSRILLTTFQNGTKSVIATVNRDG